MSGSAASDPAVLDPARFDELWDFHDPAASEARFRAIRPRAGDGGLRLQIDTQIARALGLQRRFDAADALLDEVEIALPGAPASVRVRYLLERGRVANSSGRKDHAKARFLEAWEAARACGEDGSAVDAAHMVAIAGTPDEAMHWNGVALDLARASADPRARRWKGSLLNNLGWTCHERGEPGSALAHFEEALAVRTEEGRQPELDIARWCVARCMRTLGRLDEALAMQRAIADGRAASGREEDGYVAEEMGECLLGLGRADEARPWFARAHVLLSTDPWLRAEQADRLARLARLGERDVAAS